MPSAATTIARKYIKKRKRKASPARAHKMQQSTVKG